MLTASCLLFLRCVAGLKDQEIKTNQVSGYIEKYVSGVWKFKDRETSGNLLWPVNSLVLGVRPCTLRHQLDCMPHALYSHNALLYNMWILQYVQEYNYRLMEKSSSGI